MKDILPITLILVLLITAVCLFKGPGSSVKPVENDNVETVSADADSGETVIKSKFTGSYAKNFNDLPDRHMESANRLGIKPIGSLKDVWHLHQPIEKVSTCADFVVDDLTHSYAYLVPDAAHLLHEIGSAFRDSLTSRGYSEYRPIVTSVLRTMESVKRLKRGNVNSVENSAHLYGTTFDISHVRFNKVNDQGRNCSEGELKRVLAEVLLDLRDRHRCWVKHERKQACFHITVAG